MVDLITTAEAAKLTRHKTHETFRRWAKRFCPSVLRRCRGRRETLVDKKALLKYLAESEAL